MMAWNLIYHIKLTYTKGFNKVPITDSRLDKYVYVSISKKAWGLER